MEATLQCPNHSVSRCPGRPPSSIQMRLRRMVLCDFFGEFLYLCDIAFDYRDCSHQESQVQFVVALVQIPSIVPELSRYSSPVRHDARKIDFRARQLSPGGIDTSEDFPYRFIIRSCDDLHG